MKKIILIVLIALFCNCSAFCAEFYTVLKTTNNYTPIRLLADENSERFTHLKSNIKLYSNLQKGDFYKVDFGNNTDYWVEKKYVNVVKTNQTKKITQIKKIRYLETPKHEILEISFDNVPTYSEIEQNNSIEFTLFDCLLPQKLSDYSDFLIYQKENLVKIGKYNIKTLNGHNVELKGKKLILKVKKPFEIDKNAPLKNLIFVIDPGHGGREYGAVAFNLEEKNINLQISKILYRELKKQGAKAYLTRKKDKYYGLYERVDFAKKKKADFLISIHQNSLPDITKVNKKHGVGVYYYNMESYPLAFEIEQSLLKETKFRDDGINHRSFALNRSADFLSLLIECGYIIHPFESAMLSNPNFQTKVSKGIMNGIKNYLLNNF